MSAKVFIQRLSGEMEDITDQVRNIALSTSETTFIIPEIKPGIVEVSFRISDWEALKKSAK